MYEINENIRVSIPEEVRILLNESEKVYTRYDLKGLLSFRPNKIVYATDYRLIIDEGKFIRDIMYKYVPSLSIRVKLNLWLIIIGLLGIIFGLSGLYINIPFLKDLLPNAVDLIFCFIGVILIIIGCIPKRVIEIFVVGMPRPYVLEGTGVRLQELFRIIRSHSYS